MPLCLKILKSEKGSLPLNGYIRAIQQVWVKNDKSNHRNVFPDHENIGIGTFIKFVLSIVSVLCQFFNFRIMAEHKHPPWWQILENFQNFLFFIKRCPNTFQISPL